MPVRQPAPAAAQAWHLAAGGAGEAKEGWWLATCHACKPASQAKGWHVLDVLVAFYRSSISTKHQPCLPSPCSCGGAPALSTRAYQQHRALLKAASPGPPRGSSVRGVRGGAGAGAGPSRCAGFVVARSVCVQFHCCKAACSSPPNNQALCPPHALMLQRRRCPLPPSSALRRCRRCRQRAGHARPARWPWCERAAARRRPSSAHRQTATQVR